MFFEGGTSRLFERLLNFELWTLNTLNIELSSIEPIYFGGVCLPTLGFVHHFISSINAFFYVMNNNLLHSQHAGKDITRKPLISITSQVIRLIRVHQLNLYCKYGWLDGLAIESYTKALSGWSIGWSEKFFFFFFFILKSCRWVWWTRIPKEKKTKNILS